MRWLAALMLLTGCTAAPMDLRGLAIAKFYEAGGIPVITFLTINF